MQLFHLDPIHACIIFYFPTWCRGPEYDRLSLAHETMIFHSINVIDYVAVLVAGLKLAEPVCDFVQNHLSTTAIKLCAAELFYKRCSGDDCINLPTRAWRKIDPRTGKSS